MTLSGSEHGSVPPKMPTTPRPVNRLTSRNSHPPFSTPKTPELSFVETPPAIEDPRTPEDDYDSDGGAYLLGSPLAARDRSAHVVKMAGHGHLLPDQEDCVEDAEDIDGSDPKGACEHISQWRIDTHGGIQNTSKTLSKGSEHASSFSHGKSESEVPVGPLALLPWRSVADSFRNVKTRTTATIAHQDALEGTPFKKDSTKTIGGHNATVGAKEEPEHDTEVPIRIPESVTDISDAEATIESKKESIATSLVAALSSGSAQPQPMSLGFVWQLSTTLSGILPLDTIERLQTKPEYCIASTKGGRRCAFSNGQNGMPGLTKADVDSLLNKVVRINEAPQPTVVAAHIRELVSRATCSRWHQGEAQDRMEELCSYSFKVDALPPAPRAVATMIDCVFEVWIESLMRLTTRPENAVVLDNGPTDSLDVNVASAIAPVATTSFGKSEVSLKLKEAVIVSSTATTGCAVKSGKQDVVVNVQKNRVAAGGMSTHLNHKFEKFVWSKKKASLSTQDLLRITLFKPLSDTDTHRSGFIYVFWHPVSFGYVKIGFSKDVDKRLKAWKWQCGFDLEQHNPEERVELARVKHLHRVEALVHAELRDYRMIDPKCSRCGKKHTEWFNVSASHALRVVAKWTQLSLYSDGHLRQDITEKDIDKMCRLLDVQEFPLTRRQGQAVRSSDGSKYKGRRDTRDRRRNAQPR
ncbi:hypothetical protein PV05_08144 [Exophiala xenobiotica]|uniref:Bacteriophage T5 Orf172 DNA-binding domain-containing protein n=1 Tax=Exophiala xenobiotica TaxID=348802 RepID=A0A0D2EB40_9EURO|nr:uncharacterized protein PV05_08144 [Exophiala xenobiotica]KIW52513.1 hypothetical protein PV05_08144 [Exophiala xenobiotica]